MEKLIIRLNFGQDSGSILITIMPQSKVNLTLIRSSLLLNSVNNFVKMYGVNSSIELDIDVSACNQSFTLGYFLNNLQSDFVERCRDRKADLLVPLIKKFELEPDFVKLLLPRKIMKKNCAGLHSLYMMPIYRSVIHEFYMFDSFGISKPSGIISYDEFIRLLHEVKTCHEHFLVYILPNCICFQCTKYRTDRLEQLSDHTYPTPYYGCISNSPFRNIPRSEGVNQSTNGRPG